MRLDDEAECHYICGEGPDRRANIGGLGRDCEPMGGSMGGGRRASRGTSCDEVGGGTFSDCGLKLAEKVAEFYKSMRIRARQLREHWRNVGKSSLRIHECINKL